MMFVVLPGTIYRIQYHVLPYLSPFRTPRTPQVNSRVPISAADVSRLLEAMGIDRVVCVDLHCGQIQARREERGRPAGRVGAGEGGLGVLKSALSGVVGLVAACMVFGDFEVRRSTELSSSLRFCAERNE